jgi:hypothetical protein
MLRDGTLPEGYTVKRRRLVITGDVAATSKKSKKSTSKQSEQGKKRKDKRIRPIAA